MIIKLNYLHLQNFKGARDFKLVINGKNANVYGDNDRGKTTLQDAWNWLLFDKNSENVADTTFAIKPQDSLGRDINHLQTVVEAELLVDGKPLKLKKLREERWVTRRGTAEQVMDGHTKLYWFNEVPTTATKYKAQVDELINEDIFKKITDPLYFNLKIDWKERRDTLFEISGHKTDEEVIASDESLSRLTSILNGRSIDDFKLVLADQLKNYKKERDNLPPRIDELTLSLPQEEIDYTGIEEELNKNKETLQGIEFLLTNATNIANKISEKYRELNRLKQEQNQLMEKIKAETNTDRIKLVEKKQELDNGKILLESGISTLKMQIDQIENTLHSNSQIRERLLTQWKELNANRAQIMLETFEVGELATNCPMCNQSIPQEQIDTQIEELKAKFEQDKAERLKTNQTLMDQNMAEGKALKVSTDELTVELSSLKTELEDKQFKLENLQISIKALDEELSKPIPEPDYTKYPEMNELSKKIDDLAYELDQPVEDKSTELLNQKAEIQSKIDELNKVLNNKVEIEKRKARIEELKKEEKRVSTKIAKLEGHKFLLDKFLVAKVNLLEDTINSQFKHVKFKLFEENITNEGVNPTCIALVNTNGSYVPFLDANDAGKINTGIDVINSLSRFYGVTVPLFVDNAERVTDIAETDAQVIRLIKPEIPAKRKRLEDESELDYKKFQEKRKELLKKYSKLVVEVE